MMTTNENRDPYLTAAQEDRSAPRTRLTIPASLRPSGSKGYQTVVRDLSLSGFSATAINRLHKGTLVWLTLPGMESLQATVVWWDNGLVGCAFESLLSPIIHDNLLARWRGDGTYTG
ncbi:pilus assembly protein PilZ [Novosphingobium sp. PC22D]|uniref:PilZ domain-containing protein n=1 Tax=Novosphingobium sp. PC22D TaxID=1962403 RepID=UPI000BF08C1E|nr:PilZ domain-containing protein [Novosphingobium sp. PC22D]PEQ13256.1 pilus assembly protein PilZ [Novosphingobium sp. PC22D]